MSEKNQEVEGVWGHFATHISVYVETGLFEPCTSILLLLDSWICIHIEQSFISISRDKHPL